MARQKDLDARPLVIALGLAVAAASPAVAQTTTCGWEFGKWVCRSRDAAPPLTVPNASSWINAFEAGRRDAEAEAPPGPGAPAAPPVFNGRPYAPVGSTMPGPEVAIMRAIVIDYVKAGRCDDAVSAALTINDLDLADKAKRVCVPGQTQGPAK